MAVNFLKIRTGATLKPNAAPGTPENGDIYYDSGTNQFNFYQNGAFVQIPAATTYRAGQQSISNASTSQAITFSSTFGTTNYGITVTMKNTTDSNPQFQPVEITTKSATGITVTWNAPTDSANYVLEFTALLNN